MFHYYQNIFLNSSTMSIFRRSERLISVATSPWLTRADKPELAMLCRMYYFTWYVAERKITMHNTYLVSLGGLCPDPCTVQVWGGAVVSQHRTDNIVFISQSSIISHSLPTSPVSKGQRWYLSGSNECYFRFTVEEKSQTVSPGSWNYSGKCLVKHT